MVMENSSSTSPTQGSFYIICMTLDGIPLFSRSHGNVPALPFPIVGSLNGVHMFIKNNTADMGITMTENAKIVWKDSMNIKLILVYFDVECVDSHLSLLIGNVYKAMVMIVGENELSKISNVEKLKKKLRLCIPFVMNYLNSKSLLIGNITQQTDVVLHPDLPLVQNCLNAFAEECQSEFACLTFHNKVVTGTEKFWQLIPVETSLMLYLQETMPLLTASDIPIYLPHGSPNIPHRLIGASLVEDINVLLVCGPEPSLEEILQKYVKKHWLPFLPVLKSCARLYPRCFPPEIKFDQNLISFILMNTRDDKCLSSFYPHGNMTAGDQPILSHVDERKRVLLKFYKSVIGSTFVDKVVLGNKSNDSEDFSHDSIETYTCTSRYKCYALQTSTHKLFTLFTTEIPTYSLAVITRQTLKQLTKGHGI